MIPLFFLIGASLVTGTYLLVLLKMMDVADKCCGYDDDKLK